MAAPAPDPIDDRLLRVEEKLSFTEDLVEELNRMIARQQQQIEALGRELVRYRRQVEALAEHATVPGTGDAADERPPHY
jgi:SlyX protein